METSIRIVWSGEDPVSVSINGRDYCLSDVAKVEDEKERARVKSRDYYHKKKSDPVWWAARQERARLRYLAARQSSTGPSLGLDQL